MIQLFHLQDGWGSGSQIQLSPWQEKPSGYAASSSPAHQKRSQKIFAQPWSHYQQKMSSAETDLIWLHYLNFILMKKLDIYVRYDRRKCFKIHVGSNTLLIVNQTNRMKAKASKEATLGGGCKMGTCLYLCSLGDAQLLVLSSGEWKAPGPGWWAGCVCRQRGKGWSKHRSQACDCIPKAHQRILWSLTLQMHSLAGRHWF